MKVNASRIPSNIDIIDWLSEHDQAYQDCQDYFGIDNLEDIDPDDILDWIFDHDRLAEDFSDHFGKLATGDEYLYQFMEELKAELEDMYGVKVSNMDLNNTEISFDADYYEGDFYNHITFYMADYDDEKHRDMMAGGWAHYIFDMINDGDIDGAVDEATQRVLHSLNYWDIDKIDSATNITADSIDDRDKLIYIVNQVVDQLYEEYQFIFKDVGTGTDGKSFEFDYGIASNDDCNYYVDDDLNPDLFEMISENNIADAIEMIKAEVISNYTQDWGPIESATNTSGIDTRVETITAEDKQNFLSKLWTNVKSKVKYSVKGINWYVEDGEISLDIVTKNDKVLNFNIPLSDLSFDISKLKDDVKYILDSVTSCAGIDASIKASWNSWDDSDEWYIMETKQVKDFDGFWTDYTLWHNVETDEVCCVFGDKDLYNPENADWDAGPFEMFEDAYEWFTNYQGAEEEDEMDEDEMDFVYNSVTASDDLEDYTATDVVRDMYSKFPEVGFIGENERGGMVRLHFVFDDSFDRRPELSEFLESTGFQYHIVPQKTAIREYHITVVAPSDEPEDIESSEEFFDKGEGAEYWYFTTHGVQPGSVPKGLEIIDVVDRPEGSYFLTNRVLTTDSLKYYDIKERAPK